MLRRHVFALLLVVALAAPEEGAAQSFSWCSSITSGACYGGALGNLNLGSVSSANFQSVIDGLLQQIQSQVQLQNINLSSLLAQLTGTVTTTRPPVSVPEPGTFTLLATGLFGVAYVGRRKRRD